MSVSEHHFKNPLFSAFRSVVTSDPNRIALHIDGNDMSFTQLCDMVETCAGWLHAMLVDELQLPTKPRVILKLPKAPLTYALWLACIRQGIIYTFVDPKSPDNRTAKIIDRLEPALVISNTELDNKFGASVLLANLDNADLNWEEEHETPNVASVSPDHPVYVMFTSGSTGEPKGAVIPTRGVVNLMRWARDSVIPLVNVSDSGSHLRFSALNPLHFDNSVFDLFCGLLNGHTLVPVETSIIANPAGWIAKLNHGQAQVIFAVPSLFQLLLKLRLLSPERLPKANLFVFGGEGFPVEQLRIFLNIFSGRARLLNVYGPTETSCICSSLEINDDALARSDVVFPSIGKMHRGYAYSIINETGQPAESGAQGELWIGGENVGLGYFRDTQISKAAFRQSPLHDSFRDIWYKTGDLVIEDATGHLWFAGRADNQIKFRGYRIELEEIDACLERLKGIERANTVLLKKGDEDILASAYCGAMQHDLATIIKHCHENIPAYMAPAFVAFLPELPKNANGKVDRRAIKKILTEMVNSN